MISLHEKVVKRKLEEYEHSLRGDEKLDIEQIEGVHYKLMYTGRKLFWRTQDSVDFCFYNHFECKCVEVIGIHPETNAEVNRIYLDHSMLMRIIAEFFARKEFSEQELKLIASQTEEEKDESLRLSLITFMLLRLAIQDDSKSLYCEGNSICFRLSPSDPADSCPQLDTRPETCRPVQVNHRRRSSVEEINSTIQNLADETSAIMLATERAIQNSNEVSIALDAARSLSTPAQVAV